MFSAGETDTRSSFFEDPFIYRTITTILYNNIGGIVSALISRYAEEKRHVSPFSIGIEWNGTRLVENRIVVLQRAGLDGKCTSWR